MKGFLSSMDFAVVSSSWQGFENGSKHLVQPNHNREPVVVPIAHVRLLVSWLSKQDRSLSRVEIGSFRDQCRGLRDDGGVIEIGGPKEGGGSVNKP